MEPPYKKRRIDDEDLDSDYFENDGFIVFGNEINRKKRKRRKKKKNRKYNLTPLTEDEKRMIAEFEGKVYKKDIDIDQGVLDIDNVKFDSDSDSDSSDSHQNKRKLIIKRSIIDDDHNDESDDDESDELYETNNTQINTNNEGNDEMDGFNGFIEERLYQLFGNNIYSFLNMSPPPNYDIDAENEDNTIIIPVIAEKTCPTPPITKKTKLKLPVRSFPVNRINGINGINSSNPVCYKESNNNNDLRELRHRNIDYPLFYNISRNEAYNRLSKESVFGQILFRPSSRDCRKLNCLSMTWKMYGDLYSNIFVDTLIIEKDKLFQNSIGKTLIIDGEKYEDLDEIYSNIPSLNKLVDDMMNHKHFRFGDKKDIKQMLSEEINSNNNGMKGCYSISFAYQRPGYFLLSYISNKRSDIKTEYIEITGKGYKFRYKYYKTPSDVINFWKRNPKKKRSQKQHKMK